MFLIFQPDNSFTFNGTLEVLLSMTSPVPHLHGQTCRWQVALDGEQSLLFLQLATRVRVSRLQLRACAFSRVLSVDGLRKRETARSLSRRDGACHFSSFRDDLY